MEMSILFRNFVSSTKGRHFAKVRREQIAKVINPKNPDRWAKR